MWRAVGRVATMEYDGTVSARPEANREEQLRAERVDGAQHHDQGPSIIGAVDLKADFRAAICTHVRDPRPARQSKLVDRDRTFWRSCVTFEEDAVGIGLGHCGVQAVETVNETLDLPLPRTR